jgi:hypothetical protein
MNKEKLMWKMQCLDMFNVPPLLSVAEASFGEEEGR